MSDLPEADEGLRIAAEEQARLRRGMAIKRAAVLAAQILLIVALLVGWELAPETGLLDPFYISRPHLVFGAHNHAFLFVAIALMVLIDSSAVRCNAWRLDGDLRACRDENGLWRPVERLDRPRAVSGRRLFVLLRGRARRTAHGRGSAALTLNT